MVNKLGLMCLLLCGAPCFALGIDVSYEDMHKYYFSDIQSIDTCGQWLHKGELGEFRIIRLFHAGQDMLFVDVTKLNANESGLEVVKGFSIREFNNDHAELGITQLHCTSEQANKIEIGMQVLSGHSDEQYQVILHIDGVTGRYLYIETR